MDRFRKNHLAIALMTACFLLLSLGYSNCMKVTVAGEEEEVVSEPIADDDLTDVKSPEYKTPDELIMTCAYARIQGRLTNTVLTRPLAARSGCQWGVSGNLSAATQPSELGINRARNEEIEVFEAPLAADGSKATICSVKLETNVVPSFDYSEAMLFTLNGYVLASSTNFNRRFESRHGFYIYDWNNLVGLDGQMDPADSTPDQQYCAGQEEGVSTCSLPQTGAAGSASLDLDPYVAQTVLGMTNEKTLSFGIVTTGDDSSSDCSHGAFDLKLNVEYISN